MVVPTGWAAAEFAVFGFDLGRMRTVFLAAGQGQAADGGDTGQAFAAKAHAGNVFQIVQGFDFAGGVAVEREFDVVGVDAAAVVADADEADAAAFQFHINRRCARVYAVFNDFFQGVGRAFDHFAGGNLVDEVVGQGGNAWHKAVFRCKKRLIL